jgi:hypothetical protein
MGDPSSGGAQLGLLLDCMRAAGGGGTCVAAGAVAAAWSVVAGAACSANKRLLCLTTCPARRHAQAWPALAEHTSAEGTPGVSVHMNMADGRTAG